MQYFQPLDKPDDPNAPYVNGDIETGKEGSCPDARGFEAPQREIVNALIAAGLTPSAENFNQLAQAIRLLSGQVIHYQSLYQSLRPVENGVVYAKDEQIIGWAEITADTTFSFNMDNLTKTGENDVTTFELYVNMPTPVGVIWPTNVDWGREQESPDMSEAGLYLLTFRYVRKIDKWQASPQRTFAAILPPEPETPIDPEIPAQE